MKKIFLFIITFMITIVGICSLLINNSINTQAVLKTSRIEEDLPIVYRQNDYRWNYHVHGGGTIGGSACGLLSVTNAVNYLNGNFIAPLELADYAYSIQAYNTPEGGGTWRYIFYRQLECFEKKYGFKVTNPGTEQPLNDAAKQHLKNGGAVIALVPGHFIALVEYDETTNSFLVYDSAASASKRHTYYRATWLTEAELSGDIDAMKIQWHCLIKNTVSRETHLDGFENDTNGRANATFTLSYADRGNNLPISGYAAYSSMITRYYYTVDYQKEQYPLQGYDRVVELKNPNVLANQAIIGFKGAIDTSNFTMGTHYAYVIGETEDGGTCTIAEIEIRIASDNPYTENNTFTVDMGSCYKQVDVQENNNKYTFVANYGSILDLGKINLANIQSATIYYSVNSSFDSDKCGIQSVIGLKKTLNYFGYYGSDIDFNSSLGYVNMQDGTSIDNVLTANIDLSNSDYNGHVYLNAYNQEGELYYVHKVVFQYKNTYSPTINHSESIKTLSETPYYLGNYQLNDDAIISINATFNEEVTVKAIDDNYQVLGELTVYPGMPINSNLIILNTNAKANVYLISNKNLSFDSIKVYKKSQYEIFKDCDSDWHSYLLTIDSTGKATYQTSIHTAIYDSTIEPTCLEGGLARRTCVVCNYIIENESLSKLGHDYGDLMNDNQHYQICLRCGIYDNYENHSFHQSYDNKYHYQECNCGYTKDQEFHVYNEQSKCSVCGNLCSHEKVKKTIRVEATCISTGKTEQVSCKTCGRIIEESKEIEMTSHTFADGVCTFCGEEEEIEFPTPSCSKVETSGTIILIMALICFVPIIKKKH